MARKQIITTAEAAELTGKSVRTIQEACKNGIISGSKTGNIWMVEKSSIKEYIRTIKAAERAKAKKAKTARKGKK